ncbi:MAG: hypothetical protein JOY62_13220 [Acidobacteriaceae bacterium]|nr:hypothetical protein [Acidobacteriaceae bacterium]MBV9780921.1 hypothetical protein [Acidobacteriaceae bacterium]
MGMKFGVYLALGSVIFLCGPGLLAAAENASFRAQLVPVGDADVVSNLSATADINVHVVRDVAGKIVHGYVDFRLEGALSGSASELRIETGSDGTGGTIAVPPSDLPRNVSGSLHMRSSAPVRSGHPAALETLKALVEGSTPVHVTLVTSQGTMHGAAQRSTNSLLEAEPSDDGVWKQVDEASLAVRADANANPPRFYRTFHLDHDSLKAVLHQAPMQFTKGAKPVISMPMPDGQFAHFSIEESPVMVPELAAKVPDFKTYRGQGVDNPAATIRFDSNKGAVHVIILVGGETVYINPVAAGEREHYATYYRRDLPWNEINTHGFGPDSVVNPLENSLKHAIPQAAAPPQVGTTLQTYRLAVATTKGFTADPFFGGGGDGLAARMTTLTKVGTIINLVNALYESDVAVQLVLIPTELSAIFDTSTNPDPGYADGNENTMINQNQGFLDAAVGNANYDIGHVFGLTGNPGSAQGFAFIGVVCTTAMKGAAVTLMGVGTVTGNFNVDTEVLDHEMAHQFSASHTTNSTSAFCAIERNAPTAFEVGSGSTILANAGSCDPENLQQNTDIYFHGHTLDEINAYVAGPGACFVGTPTGDSPPTVTAPASTTVPMATPFTLTATATTALGTVPTFNWEEFDLGTASPPEGDDGTRPLFRSVAPNTNGTRNFPNMTYVLNNANQPPATIPCPDVNTSTCIPGEYPQMTNRTLNFRVTVRDNHAGGGATNNATLQVTSTTAAGPFQVTAPNTAVTWQTGSTQTVTWNVANTNAAPVNTANVNVLLSTDGGNTFPTTLAANVPNNGSATVTTPNTPTATARVMVQAVGNIFFDVSDVNFNIVQPNMTPVTVNAAATGPFQPTTATAGPHNAQRVATASSVSGLADLTFTVDGCRYTGSHTFMFRNGSKHTISTTAFQCTGTTQSEFTHYSNGCNQRTQAIIASAKTPVYTAFFNVKFELKTSVAHSGGGTVTPESGKFYADGSTVKVTAIADPGYVFSYWTGIRPHGQWYPEQKREPESPVQEVVMNEPKDIVAHFKQKPTCLTGSITSKSGPTNQRVWTIQVHDDGPGLADATIVKSIDLKQTSGSSCKPVVKTALPARVGNLAPKANGVARITIDFTGCSQDAQFSTSTVMVANGGTAKGFLDTHNERQ